MKRLLYIVSPVQEFQDDPDVREDIRKQLQQELPKKIPVIYLPAAFSLWTIELPEEEKAAELAKVEETS